MKTNFTVFWDGGYYSIYSKVYAVDMTRDRFLIVDDQGWFRWVPTDECRLDGKEDDE